VAGLTAREGEVLELLQLLLLLQACRTEGKT